MVLLDVICLVVALAAIAFAVIAILRARGADDRSVVAASSAAQAETSARAAAAGLEQLEERLGQARQEAASAAQQAARAAQAAAQASASAAASRREAEAASDKAARAELEAAHAETTVAHLQEDRGEADGATESDEFARAIDADGRNDGRGQQRSSTPEPAVSGRATVQRAEDHDVAVGGSGATERVVQVAWRLERVRGSIWVVRNTGFAKARDALLSDATVPPKFVRPDEVIPRDVDREDVLQFRVTAGRGTPPPRIRVTWREGAGSPAYSREFTVLGGS